MNQRYALPLLHLSNFGVLDIFTDDFALDAKKIRIHCSAMCHTDTLYMRNLSVLNDLLDRSVADSIEIRM